jgi:hypothetical protein
MPDERGWTEPNPGTLVGRMRQIAYDLLQEHARDGMLPTSIRFLFYELVQRGLIAKHSPPGDKRSPAHLLTAALIQLRKSGVIPWDFIVDETRALHNYSGYVSIAEGVATQLEYIRLDPWEGAPPLVLTESRSLAGVLRGTCSEYCVSVAATNGQVGGFLRTDVAPVLQPADRVLYFGDWDLAGGDIEAHTRRVLEPTVGGLLRWERLALTREQVERYDLPTIVKDDKRFKDGRGRHEAVETEALSQSTIIDILRDRLDRLLPEPLPRVLERERLQRRAIARKLELRGD